MKITHIIIGLNVGGAELMLQRLVLNSSKKADVEHSIISLTDLGIIGPKLQAQGINVYSLGMKSLISVPVIFFKLHSTLKKIQPDVVQTWMYHADFLGGLAAKSLGVKKIFWGVRTTDVSQGKSQLTVYLSKICAKLSYKIPSAIICAAHTSMNYHIRIGYDASKMIVIPNGFEIASLIATNEASFEVRKINNIEVNDIVIGSIGRFNPVKNQRLFIQTAAHLIKHNPTLKFMMIGRDNTTHNTQLMSWIKAYDLENNFILLGQRSNIPKYLKAMDIFCLHSKTEGFPNVLVEAMASGVACVSTDVGDAKYILKNHGRIVPSDNVNCLKSAIQETIDQVILDRDKLKAENPEVLEYLKSNYSIETIYQQYLEVWTAG